MCSLFPVSLSVGASPRPAFSRATGVWSPFPPLALHSLCSLPEWLSRASLPGVGDSGGGTSLEAPAVPSQSPFPPSLALAASTAATGSTAIATTEARRWRRPRILLLLPWPLGRAGGGRRAGPRPEGETSRGGGPLSCCGPADRRGPPCPRPMVPSTVPGDADPLAPRVHAQVAATPLLAALLSAPAASAQRRLCPCNLRQSGGCLFAPLSNINSADFSCRVDTASGTYLGERSRV